MSQVIVTKICSNPNCLQPIKSLVEFYKNKTRNDGYCNWCKICEKEYHYKYYLKNKSHVKIIHHQHYIQNRHKYKQQNKQWCENNLKQCQKTKRQYNNKNKFKRNIQRKIRYNTDLNFKLICGLRRRINKKIKYNKADHAINVLGCSCFEYNYHLESQFYNNMTWEMQGSGHGKWQIHHICPLEFFDLNDPIEQKQAFSYTNTKPLWYKDHVEEHRKINERMTQYNPKDIYPWKYN